jgi:PAS domain S-box-containing protein
LSEPFGERSSDEASRAARYLDGFLRASSDGLVITDSAGTILEASDSFCSLLGQTRADVVATRLLQWLKPSGAAAERRWTELE